MKKSVIVLVAAIMAAVCVAIVSAKTVGITYTDGIQVPYNGTATATLDSAGALVVTSIDTGDGASELYLMDQGVATTDSVTFVSGTFSGSVNAVTGTFSQNLYVENDLHVTSDATFGGYVGVHRVSKQEVVQITPTVQGLHYFCVDCLPARPIWSVIGSWVYGDGSALE